MLFNIQRPIVHAHSGQIIQRERERNERTGATVYRYHWKNIESWVGMEIF